MVHVGVRRIERPTEDNYIDRIYARYTACPMVLGGGFYQWDIWGVESRMKNTWVVQSNTPVRSNTPEFTGKLDEAETYCKEMILDLKKKYGDFSPINWDDVTCVGGEIKIDA